MLEKYAFYVLMAGLGLAAVGFLWLVVAAFRVSKPWGFGVLLFPPLALAFIPKHFRKAAAPLVVLLLAGALLGAPYAVNFYNEKFVALGPREKIVNGEAHITLTGWDGSDYSVLAKKPGTVVLQMANPDVNDDTLVHLKGMTHLRELDLSDTKVTDAGLPILAELPRLEQLRLARTKITDDGFQKNLAAKESLLKLDLTGTAVKGKSKREWKKARAGREYLD